MTHDESYILYSAINQMLNKPEYKMKELGALAYFRVPEPWRPLSARKGGVTRGGGAQPIHRWVTPIKARQILMEIDVDCSFDHIYPILLAGVKSVEGQSHAVNFSDPQDTKGHMIQHGTLMPIQQPTLIITEL